jgi:hypothetical protein
MINFIQSNQHVSKENINNTMEIYIISNEVWEKLIDLLLKRENIDIIKIYIQSISIDYNIDKKNIIKDFIHYQSYYHYYLNDRLIHYHK